MGDTTTTTVISKGSLVSHILLWIVILAIGVWLVYAATHTKTKNDNFSGNAKQTNNYHVTRNYALVALDLALTPFNIQGCTKADKPEQEINEETNEVKNDTDFINKSID